METVTTVNPAEQAGRQIYLSRSVWRCGAYSVTYSRRELLVGLFLFGLLCLSAVYATTVGKFPLSLSQVTDILGGVPEHRIQARVLFHIRLPRIATAIFAGCALGASGAVFQSVSRNVLGSPDIIGFTSGAATGALIQIVLFSSGTVAVALAAIGGGLATAVVVYLLSFKSGSVGYYRLILTGIGVGAVLSALNGLLLVKGNIDDALTANLWLSGSLHARNWTHALPVMVGVAVLLPLMKWLARPLMMIEMGDEMAKQLGIRIERVRLMMMLFAVILAALATGAAGPIAFIALAAPQLARRLRRSGHLPVFSAALMGGLLLLAADLLTQLIPLDLIIPIGRMTGIVGGIYLLWLLNSSRLFR
ncbi:Ferric enterobactin transport system permease protein FepG [Vibrio aerogenes CECT 7868]|uniref:Ferric enterobactin transport system permease protein FepG n=1 Tax=Vibrio aerogenes CECT 7868 TaxID=1216006 RepID=A0A1M5XBU4_9VIBR|nr:iron chelate uptake ABC transporter family permease subunit [Vibrio aerogenes]SHH97290.1 Ferric enterobactin transport system permease protein FepG [Vibrio aerogenes CECT 7868]